MTPSREIHGISHRQSRTQRCKPHPRLFLLYRRSSGMRRQLLVSEGFEVMNISLVPRQTPLPGHILEWLRLFTMTSTFFEGIGLDETEAMLGEVADACEVDAKDVDNDRWMIMYVRLRVLAKCTA